MFLSALAEDWQPAERIPGRNRSSEELRRTAALLEDLRVVREAAAGADPQVAASALAEMGAKLRMRHTPHPYYHSI